MALGLGDQVATEDLCFFKAKRCLCNWESSSGRRLIKRIVHEPSSSKLTRKDAWPRTQLQECTVLPRLCCVLCHPVVLRQLTLLHCPAAASICVLLCSSALVVVRAVPQNPAAAAMCSLLGHRVSAKVSVEQGGRLNLGGGRGGRLDREGCRAQTSPGGRAGWGGGRVQRVNGIRKYKHTETHIKIHTKVVWAYCTCISDVREYIHIRIYRESL